MASLLRVVRLIASSTLIMQTPLNVCLENIASKMRHSEALQDQIDDAQESFAKDKALFTQTSC